MKEDNKEIQNQYRYISEILIKLREQGLNNPMNMEEIDEIIREIRKEKETNKKIVQVQRKIGQQIMAIRIIRNEQRKNFSSLKIGDIAEAMGVSKEEVRELIDYCERLDWRILGTKVAVKLESRNLERCTLYQSCIDRYAGNFFLNILENGNENIDLIIMLIKNYIEKEFEESDEIEAIVNEVKKGIMMYGRMYVEAISEMRNKAYDWSIISELLGKYHAWSNLFLGENADENFNCLKQIVERNI